MLKITTLWEITEGFIQCQRKGESQFELGEVYFSELMNRSLIQPMIDGYSATIKYCRVHDMILDLICSLSSEENFVAALNDVDQTRPSPSKKIWRLSLQNNKVHHATDLETMCLRQVRSVLAFPSAFHLMPALPRFRVLRVLDLDGCDVSQGDYSLTYIGNLLHLRYLGLRHTRISELPEEIGNMRFLQTLDIRCNEGCRLPSAVVQLSDLMCLRISNSTRVPIKIIGSLTSLEDLSTFSIYKDSMGTVKELGHLTELRVLDIVCQTEQTDTTEKNLQQALRKLQKIQSLDILIYGGDYNLDTWVAPPCLRRLRLGGCWFSTLPGWMNSSLLQDLSFLWISMRVLKQDDIEILGRLPTLSYLNLKVDQEKVRATETYCVSECSFPCLVFCSLWGFGGPVLFRQAAMPKLRSLRFIFPVQEAREIFGNNGSFDLGLGNLASLEDIIICLQCKGANEEEVEEGRTAVRRAAETHPNRPILEIY